MIVTNLDLNIAPGQMRRTLLNLFRNHAHVLHAALFKQSDGSVAASVKVCTFKTRMCRGIDTCIVILFVEGRFREFVDYQPACILLCLLFSIWVYTFSGLSRGKWGGGGVITNFCTPNTY